MAIIEEKNPKKWTKDGRKWYFDVYYTDMYGNRKEKKSKLFKSKPQARKAETDFLLEIRTKDASDNNISFNDACNEWLKYKEQLVKPTTFYGIEKDFNKHIRPFFNNYKLHSIKINDISNWRNLLDKEKISTRTKNKQICYFKEFLIFAVDCYSFNRKIISKLQKFRNDIPTNKMSDSEVNYITYEEYEKFINIVDNDFYKLMFEFLYYTGLRFGEFRALTWNNIDLKNKTISIKESLTTKVKSEHKINNNKHIVLTPKTTNSVRIVDLDDELVKKLNDHYQHEKKIYNFSNDMFIFGNVKYIAETTFRRTLNKYLDIANVKRITPHGFRHSHVSLLIHLGCDVYEVAERIGDTVEMVLKTYYHMFPDKKKHTIKVINNLKNTR